jgi:hypothetical protein
MAPKRFLQDKFHPVIHQWPLPYNGNKKIQNHYCTHCVTLVALWHLMNFPVPAVVLEIHYFTL